jgi:redox-sensing transcriptional repressor
MEQQNKKLPFPVLQRLSQIYGVLEDIGAQGCKRVSSAELGGMIGESAHTIRKDINFCGVAGVAGAKYDVAALKALIGGELGFGSPLKCCIIGLGKFGAALLENLSTAPDGPGKLAAGFDSNVNRLETIRTTVPLFPAHRIVEIVGQMSIDIGILAVAPQQAQDAADRCCDGGITGLLNCTPAIVRPKNSRVFIRQMDIAGELRILAALAFTNKKTAK